MKIELVNLQVYLTTAQSNGYAGSVFFDDHLSVENPRMLSLLLYELNVQLIGCRDETLFSHAASIVEMHS